MSVRNDSQRMKRQIKMDVIESLGQRAGFVRLRLPEALDLRLANWVNGQIVPVQLKGVEAGKKAYAANEVAEIVVSHQVYSAAISIAPRHVKRRLARALR